MKQFYLKGLFLSLLMIVVGNVATSAQTEVTLWQEDFSSYSKDDVPSGGTYNYACTDGGSVTKIYNENTGGGTAPELLVSKNGGTFSATVPLSNIEGDLTLTFKTNKQTIKVHTTTEGVTGGVEEKLAGTHTVTFSGITTSMTEITIVFTGSGSSNVRLDDIKLVWNQPISGDLVLDRITLDGDYPTTFNVGDAFSHEGMTVTATFVDESTSEETTSDVTSSATFEGYNMSTAGTQTVTVSYTNGEVTKTATYDITVNAVAVTGITLDHETLQLKVGKTKKLTATVEPSNATDKTVAWSSNDETVATVAEDGTVTAVAEGNATITAATPDGAQTATCAVTVVSASTATDYYEKVTSAPEDWSGEYLIVYEGEDSKVAFDGSLSTLDAVGNTIDVEIEDNKIEATEEVDASAFTIATTDGGYSIKSASGNYIGVTSNSNGLLQNATTAYAHNLSISNGDAVIEAAFSGSTMSLRYNYASNQLRFRYYKNSGQQAIQLYKKADTSTAALTGIALSGEYPTTFKIGDEFSHEGMTVIATFDDGTTKDVTSGAVFSEPDMSTAGTKTVTVSYTKGSVTKTATYDITVSTVAVTGITLNVIEETLYVGQKLKITATIEPENATNKKLIWTSEDESVATVDENGEVTAVGVGTIIIKASAEDDNDIFGACTINVEELTGDAYTLVTSVDDLKAGNTVIIVNKEYEKAMSTTQNNNNRGAATVPFNTEDQAVVPTTSGIQVFTLEGDAEGWYFKTDEGYIYAASSSANQLKTETEKDDNAKAEITISGDETTVKFKGSNTRNLLRYNSGSDLFSCYASGQQAIQLYMREAEVTTYSLVVGEEETPFEELTLTKELPAWTDFYIKDSKGKKYYAEDGTHYVIVAENHENLNTSENDEYMFSFRKANTWVFTITEPTDAEGLKLTVNPETPAGTKYMMADDFDPSGTFQETEDVFDADGKLTKEMTTATFCIVKGDDYIYYSLGATESNAEDGNGLSVWEFSGEDNTVGFSEGNLSFKYRVSEADTYNFTLDLENNTITALPSVRKYTLVAGGDEIAFDSELKITGKELPASTEFYIKDNFGKTYYAEHGKNIISAENHENLNTYYPVEDDTPADNPEKFYFMKANTWNFTLTEPTEEGATIKLTITPQTAGETKYMLSGYLQESEDVFDENLKLTKEMTTDEFYFTRSDDYGLTNLTPATFNAPEDRRYWIFSEDAPTVEFIVGEIRGSYTVGEAGTYTFTLNLENNTITAEAVPTTYTLVVGETEYPFDGLTLTQELPAQTKFYIKDNKGHVYYSADAQSEVIIIAENHENLPTSAEGKDFYLSKANTWVFTLTEASDGLMLTVSPETAGETKYMLSAYLQESDDVFDENLKLTKEMTSTTEQFYFTRSDDYGLTNLTPATFNAPEDRRYWIFSEDAPTVEYIAGEILGSYTVGEAGTYTFTLDLENKTITAEAVPITYSLMANEGDHWAEYEFDGLILNEEFPNGTQFYIKDSKGNIYYGQYNNSVIYAENHENLSTYYPIEDSGVTEKPETFKLKKNAVWHFTITEPTEDGETIKLTVIPSTIEEETKYMLSSEYLGGTDEVFDETFDENGKVTKQLAAKEAFYISREDGFGLFNMTAAETNDPDGYYVWEFSEDAPTVGYIPAKIINAFRVKDADLYTITLDTENKTVTVEAVQTTYTLVAAGDALNEYPFDGLTLTQELPAQTKFYVKDNKSNVYHSADAQSEVIIIAENHENLPTAAEGKDFYLSKANTWVFTLTEASDGLMLTVSPETAGETKYMLSAYLQESDDVFDENLKLTKEMTSTTDEFYFTRSDDYGLTNLTPATFNAPEDRRYWIFSEDAPTVEYIAGKILGSYTVGEAGTYTFTLDLENKTVTAEKYVETADVPITSAEWATFVAPKPVMFPDDVTAYIVSRVEGNVAVGIQVTEVPAGTAVIVNGTEGTHKAVVVEEGVLPAENMLQASDGTVTGDGTIWVLAVQDGEAGFARLATGKKLSEGKAYLQVEAAGAKLQFVVDGEGTGIHGVNVDFSDGDWYNLQGVKVSTPQKGIYIHNGKKVVIK